MMIAHFLRAFPGYKWEDVMAMRVNVWFALAGTVGELDRVDTLKRVHVLTLAGQRSVPDSDFKKAMRDLRKRVVRNKKRVSEEERARIAAGVEKINAAWGEVAAEWTARQN